MKTRTFTILMLLAAWSAQSATVYVGNSLSVPNGGPDNGPPLVILDEYSPSGPLATSSLILPAGTVQDVQFYGQNYNFTLYVLTPVSSGPNPNEQTFQVVASQSFSGSPANEGIQVLPVSGLTLNAGDLLAFAGTGPYYSQNSDDALNSDATYEDSANPDSFNATPPGGAGTQFIVGINPDANATYEYVPDDFGNQGRNYGIGVDVLLNATTIDNINRYAYGANIGWMDGVVDTNNGAVIGNYVCSGFLYAANVGWINLGGGAPANGIRYQNNSATDFGVNQDGLGNLRGYAWGANIGWLNFEGTGAPKVDLRTGNLSGYVWSANCGWISLSNQFAHVQTDTLFPGQLAPNGLPVPWLLANFGTTNVNASDDPTGKGMTIAQDYLAGTDPNNADSILQITDASFSSGGTSATLSWSSVPTRDYYLEKELNLTSNTWADSGLGLVSPSAGSSTTASFNDTNAPARFYRVEAVLPLAP